MRDVKSKPIIRRCAHQKIRGGYYVRSRIEEEEEI